MIQQLLGLTKALGRMTVQTVGATAATGTLIKSMDRLTGSLVNFVKIDESLAISNRELTLATKASAFGLEGGLKANTQAQTELARVGFTGLAGGMTSLGARLKISNQSTDEFIKLNKMLLGPGGVQERSIQDFGDRIVKQSIAAGISNQDLIKAVNSLQGEMMNLSFFGGGEAAANFASTLASNVEPALTQQAGNFANKLLSLGVDFNQLQILGVEETVEKIRHGLELTTEEQLNLVNTMASRFEEITGAAEGLSGRELVALTGTLGTLGIEAKALRDGFRESTGTFDGVSKLIVSLQANFASFREAVTSLMAPAIKQFIVGFKLLGESLLIAIQPFILTLGTLAGALGLVLQVLSPIIAMVGAVAATVATVSLVTAGLGKALVLIKGIQMAAIAARASQGVGMLGTLAAANPIGLAIGAIAVGVAGIAAVSRSRESREKQKELRELKAMDRAASEEENLFRLMQASIAGDASMMRVFTDEMKRSIGEAAGMVVNKRGELAGAGD